MRIQSLRVSNFKAIDLVNLEQLGNFVLIAGPNGSGKSCLLDAIRVLKTHTGGYVHNEIDLLYQEFQLQAARERDLSSLFRDTGRPVIISAVFGMDPDETAYVQENVSELLTDFLWRAQIGKQVGDNVQLYQQRLLVAASNPDLATKVAERVSEAAPEIRSALMSGEFTVELSIEYGQIPRLALSSILPKLLFSTYKPESLGVIDFHSANRTYGREQLGSVSLSLGDRQFLKGENSLYNTNAKYQGVKGEIASAYVNEVLRRSVLSEPTDLPPTLDATLQELFEVFFPDKRYPGIRFEHDGRPVFSVDIHGSGSHDLNELSSGEKEILYGYLRLRNATPRNSVIMIDEPELHLNPALVSNLPQFYAKHVGAARGNQIILVTHSDAILGPTVGDSRFSVIHLSPASAVDKGGNQASVVTGDDDLERALVSLVGDVATYRPSGVFAILEGGGGSGVDAAGFDKTVVSRLFPRFAERVNIISSRESSRVQAVLSILQDPAVAIRLGGRFHAVIDGDGSQSELADVGRLHRWNVYHIENYLLDSRFIAEAVAELTLQEVEPRIVEAGLLEAAKSQLEELAFSSVRVALNRELVRCISLGRGRGSAGAVEALDERVRASKSRLDGTFAGFSRDSIESLLDAERQRLDGALTNGEWKGTFPGREVLKNFASTQLRGIATYEALRNLVVGKMAAAGHEPRGMREVLEEIEPSAFVAVATKE